MVAIEPVHEQPAAVLDGDERHLLIADYHAGYEVALRYEEGVELASRAPQRKERLLALIETTKPDHLIVLGDLTHSIGEPGGAERAELEVLFEDLILPVTVAKGNHDGAIESFIASDQQHFGNVSITPSGGARIGDVGIVHGHTWPDVEVLSTDTLCMGHEHPCVRLVDDVGGARIERAWVRGSMRHEPFESFHGRQFETVPELVVVPAFNALTGGTWVNVPEQDFLSPFLPAGIAEAAIYLLDGTNLGTLDATASKTT